jgi:uncharacterized protein YdaU (DUF1376 family)
MNGLPYYKAYPRDFLEATAGWDFELKGAYRLLLDLIYMHGGTLADDARFISGHLGCSVKRWNLTRAALMEKGKIYVIGNSLANLRADKELEMLRRFQDKQSENASVPRKNKGLGLATVEPKPSHTEPEPDISKREGKPSLVRLQKPTRFQEFWDAYPHGGAKKGRKPSEAKYLAAVKAGASEQDIIDAAKRYGSDRRVQAGYVKLPETWLNKNGWEDEIDTSKETQHGKPTGQGRLSAFIAGASSAPRVDSWEDCNPSQPLLARR